MVTLDRQLLDDMIAARYINVQKHPTADLFIYNYAQTAQFDRVWNDITLQCRGLILDGQFNIVARPFRKFFNLEEHAFSDLPNEPFEVLEKMDGSLGILYFIDNQPFIATRGSFISEQSARGTAILNSRYKSVLPKLNPNYTYLFEIIYPENRIVINYGDEENLILLAIIDTQTGVDMPLENIGFPIVKHYDGITDFQKLKALEEDNREGFVVKFRSGFRVKIKFAEYIRLHRILTSISNISIWEQLSVGGNMEAFLEHVPDEFFDWVKSVKADLEADYAAIERESQSVFKDLGDRKATALYFQTQKYPPILFNMLDKRDYSKTIWKRIRPTFLKAFKVEK
jgi:RNA ligase